MFDPSDDVRQEQDTSVSGFGVSSLTIVKRDAMALMILILPSFHDGFVFSFSLFHDDVYFSPLIESVIMSFSCLSHSLSLLKHDPQQPDLHRHIICSPSLNHYFDSLAALSHADDPTPRTPDSGVEGKWCRTESERAG